MARTLNRLGNAKQVAAIKTPGWHGDGGGLYLRIQNGGARSWVIVSTKGGKRVERGVGSASTVTLAQARAIRDKPESERGSRVAAEVPLFGDWADEYVAGLKHGWKNAKHKQQWENTLKTHAAPLRRLRVDAITTDDILNVLRPMWGKTPETASRLRGRIERILDAARTRGHIQSPYENPARWRGHLEHFLPRRKKSSKGHHTAIPWRAMPDFWANLMQRRESPSVMALRFTILTAARTSEAILAKWSEIDMDKALWTVPANRMKMELEHSVPLSGAALDVLKVMGEAGMPDDGYVFPGGDGKPHLSNMAMLMLLKDEMGREETVHGFRSSFRDWAGEATDYPRELAEMALAHSVGDDVENAYRRGRAIEKRRPVMDDWARFLAGDLPPPESA